MNLWFLVIFLLPLIIIVFLYKHHQRIRQMQYELGYHAMELTEKDKIITHKELDLLSKKIPPECILKENSMVPVIPIKIIRNLPSKHSSTYQEDSQTSIAILIQENLGLKTQNMQLEQDKAFLEAKYQAKLKALETKKQRLDEYHKRNVATRKGLKEGLEAILKNKDTFLPHARERTINHQLGKPKGAHGAGRHIPSIIHAIIEVHPRICPFCEGSLLHAREKQPYSHYLVELELLQENPLDYQSPRIKNIKLLQYGRWCPTCHKWIYHDSEVLKWNRFGLNFILYVIGSRIQLRLPYELIIVDLQRVFGMNLTITAPTIIGWFTMMEPYLRPIYDQLKEIALSNEFNHMDETGCPMNGENWWVWVMCNAQLTYYLLDKSRGHQAIDDLLKEYKGALVCDCWTAYEKVTQEQQKCAAHVVTDINQVIVGTQKETQRIEKELALPSSTSLSLVVSPSNSSETLPLTPSEASILTSPSLSQIPINSSPAKRRGRPKKDNEIHITPKRIIELTEQLEKNKQTIKIANRLKEFFDGAWIKGNPLGWETPKEQRWSQAEAEQQLTMRLEEIQKTPIFDPMLSKVINRCEKYKHELFTYLKFEGMPPDNNQAERDLRPFATQRKISGTFKNPNVVRSYLMFKSLLNTCEKNGKSLMPWLKEVFQSKDLKQAWSLADFLASSN